MEIIIFLFVILVILIVIYGIVEHIKFKDKVKTNTFEEYQKANPCLVNNGVVYCNKCGGNVIGIMRVYSPLKDNNGFPMSDAIAHICNTCGHTLYYSKLDK